LYIAAAYLAAIPYFVFLVDYPSATNPQDKVNLLVDHHTSMYLMHLVSFEFVALALIVVTLAVYQHLREHAPATSQVAAAVGLVRAGLLLASVMVFNHGMSVVVDQHASDPQQAAATWQVIEAVADALGGDALLGDLVRAEPGRRSPGAVDGAELATRAVLGQGITVAAARTLAARLVETHGTPLATPTGTITHLFPAALELANAGPASLPGPATRRAALHHVAHALATGELDLDGGADRIEASRRLQAIRGIGPWTSAYVAMRALGDPDAFPPGDVALRHAVTRRGGPGDVRGMAARAARWRPWRSYAVHHLWASLGATPTTRIDRDDDGGSS
jgi:3-methyladenine DNA glycosylase/8-oxoguanine DNA glycosylase